MKNQKQLVLGFQLVQTTTDLAKQEIEWGRKDMTDLGGKWQLLRQILYCCQIKLEEQLLTIQSA